MSEAGLNLNSSRSLSGFPRGKSHRTTEDKTTVGLYLPKSLVEKAKKNKLNLSKILEEALNSILSYMETQNTENASETSSPFLSRDSFQKETRWTSPSRGEGRRFKPGPAHFIMGYKDDIEARYSANKGYCRQT